MKKLVKCLVSAAFLCTLTACGGNGESDEKTIKIGASVTPHAEIIEFIKPKLEAKGYTVEIQKYSDYNMPNEALKDGQLDVNYFQHKPYLENWCKEHDDAPLVSILAVHYEPMGIYSLKHSSLEDISNNAVIAIPNDATNEARALRLLENNGIIKLREGVGLHAKKTDIIENPYSVEIIELASEMAAKACGEKDFCITNGNNALNANLKDAILTSEDPQKDPLIKDFTSEYANILAVQKGHENDQKSKDLIEVLTSEDVKAFMKEKYGDIVVPVF